MPDAGRTAAAPKSLGTTNNTNEEGEDFLAAKECKERKGSGRAPFAISAFLCGESPTREPQRTRRSRREDGRAVAAADEPGRAVASMSPFVLALAYLAREARVFVCMKIVWIRSLVLVAAASAMVFCASSCNRAGVESDAVTEAAGSTGAASASPSGASSVATIFSTPIVFYGSVQTQDGVPIAEAQVTASVADKFGGGSSKVTTQSDSQGNFSISSSGMTLGVRVSKEGYLSIPEKAVGAPRSTGAFDYGADLGQGIHQPDPKAPVIFTLFKPPASEPLNRIREKETVLPRNGKPVRISLDVPDHSLELKCSTDDANPERDGRYDWKLEVTVIGGGLQRRSDSFDFTAPSDGYGPTDLIQMPRTLERPKWQDDHELSYWVKFNDGHFGALKVRMIAGGAHYSIVSGYVHPKAGSRNLAVSPARLK